MVRRLGVLLAMMVSSTGYAQEPAASAVPLADATQSLFDQLEHMPPRSSYDVSVNVDFGEITYWRTQVPPWMGFGARVGGGKHLGDDRAHRLGMALGVQLEGPVPEYFTLAFEPQATWDHVSNGVQVGASLGPAVLWHSRVSVIEHESIVGVAPSAALRLGVSQPWSRIARRMFIVAEPRLRWVDDRPNPSVAVVVGSGRGH
jgi:hypothetical protein